MQIATEHPLSARLRRRIAQRTGAGASGRGVEPRALLDERRGGAQPWSERDRDRAAHMLLYLDEPRRVLALALEHLVRELGTAGGDAGVVDREDPRYRPAVVIPARPGAPMVEASLPNQHPVFRRAWAGRGSVSFERLRGDRSLGRLGPVFEGLGVSAMLACAVEHDGVGLGLVCIDEVAGARRWSDEERRRVEDFVGRWLGPILFAALERRCRPQLSAAEHEAVVLLAQGATYAEIGRRLGKSARTVDNQLRSARRKLGVRNGVELVRAWRRACAG